MYNDPDTGIAEMAHEIRAYAEKEIRALRYYGAGEMEARRASIVSSIGIGSERTDDEFEGSVQDSDGVDSVVDDREAGEKPKIARGRPKGSTKKAVLARKVAAEKVERGGRKK
jgi:hypothetical protein